MSEPPPSGGAPPARRRPGRAIRAALPPALLLLALSAVFVFGHDRSQFYRPGHHHSISGQGMALAANLSAEHGFLMFVRQRLDADGEPAYVAYNRFPIGTYALVGLAILPFGDSFAKQIRAAGALMLAFFAASAALAWLSLRRLLGRPWVALAATLAAFSSYYCLYYNDMISTEGSSNLFGVMLAFHGMAVFAREGRLRQLFAKTAVAVLLGWHVAGLAAAFAALGLGGELLRARADGSPGVRRALAALARSPYLAYGGFAALCCALALGFNLANEYRALGGEVAPPDLPSLRSLLRRTGADDSFTGAFGIGWLPFLRGQFAAIAAATLPYAVLQRLGHDLLQAYYPSWPPPAGPAGGAAAAAGAAAFGACLAGLRVLPHRLPFAALLLTGWGWTVPFRGSAALHEFEAMFHVGVPLVLFALALLGLRRLAGRRRAPPVLAAAALAALAAFALSAWQMGRVGHDAAAAGRERAVAADAHAIAAIARGGSVVDAAIAPLLFKGHFVRNYYLAGSYIQIGEFGSDEGWRRALTRDFLVAPADFGGSLTPENRRIHLYRPSALQGILDAFAAREPAIRSGFDVHLGGGALTWVREPCGAEDAAPRFFVEAVPLAAGDLPAGRRAAGFEELGFAFAERGLRLGGGCLARIELPDYPVAGVRTGQRAGGGTAIWEASLPAADPRFPLRAAGWDDRLAGRDPLLRAAFEVYLDGRTLTWVRDGCSAADAAPRFFLHVVPLDARDLPAERREAGFDNLDFALADRGGRFGGRCLATAELPDYGIARVRTGQFAGGERLWDGEFAFPAPRQRGAGR